jgi:hypothetical protein
MLRACLILACVAGCAQKVDEPALFEVFQITDADGASMPDSITCVAGDAIDLAIAYKPGGVTSLGDRKVQPAEKWRFLWEVRDPSEKAVLPKKAYFPELLTYEALAMEGTREEGVSKVLRWVSPEKPPKDTKDLIARWGHVRAPVEPGDYSLTVLAFPTAYPGRDEPGFWGKSS